MTASYARVAGSSPTENEQKSVPFSFIHNPLPFLFLFKSEDVEGTGGFSFDEVDVEDPRMTCVKE